MPHQHHRNPMLSEAAEILFTSTLPFATSWFW